MNYKDDVKAAEWIEKQALDSFYESAPETARRALGLGQTQIGGAAVYVARKEPSILLNRVIGLGIERPATRKDVVGIRDHFAEAGIEDHFLQVQPWIAPAATWNWLIDAGYRRNRGWTQFVRGAGPVEARGSALRVEQIDREHAMDFARIAARGFDLSDAVIPALAAMVGMPGWHHFMSFQEERPAGVAAMLTVGGIAWFDWAATDPAFRGQGSQTALLARRIQAARDLGCRRLFSETGEAVPGDPQHSFRNLVRAGFRPTHTRENHVPEALSSRTLSACPTSLPQTAERHLVDTYTTTERR